MLQLLSSVIMHLAQKATSVLGHFEDLVSELWTAFLTLLQQGAPAAKLSVVRHQDLLHVSSAECWFYLLCVHNIYILSAQGQIETKRHR